MSSDEVVKVKVDVVAAGAFGIAMATLAARRKHDVMIYARDRNVVQVINETHRSPVADAKMVILCLPAQLTPIPWPTPCQYLDKCCAGDHVQVTIFQDKAATG
ncbi:hypothetical protein KXD40_003458 [Peronospora effusa]|uniref:Glycerol-3-phosphate dehydrogenase NAD-dependent N-terminal domain-containing protein n=1 Tax=Peronospora effusa TaxID=542832 RepID=A0A3M6VCA7_9STRA|nr:hypothetical protein DD238_007773 [Peronospora effusa]UIZ22779.1 hypothetical protein KXD40_003458 [Peronospora effusa]CAI5724846.1 unnamed protein product [Peronospora effusa]